MTLESTPFLSQKKSDTHTEFKNQIVLKDLHEEMLLHLSVLILCLQPTTQRQTFLTPVAVPSHLHISKLNAYTTIF